MKHLPLALAIALAATPAIVSAQDAAAIAEKKAEHQTRPEGWRILTDDVEADTAEIYFATMSPGFHVTTGPAGIFYHQDSTATGDYRVEGTFHLFDPGSRNEAYGLFFGGRDLEGSYQAYTYFLVRRSGEYLIKRRVSSTSTETLVGWTSHDAVVGWDEREEGAASTANALAVESVGDELVFFVNGQEVDRVARSGLAVDGVAGVRINHALDVHVQGFRIGSP